MATTSEAPPSEPCDVPHGLQAGTVYGTLEDLGAEVKRLAPNSTLPASRQMKPMTSKEATSYANAHPQLARPAHGRFYCRYGQDKKRGPIRVTSAHFRCLSLGKWVLVGPSCRTVRGAASIVLCRSDLAIRRRRQRPSPQGRST